MVQVTEGQERKFAEVLAAVTSDGSSVGWLVGVTLGDGGWVGDGRDDSAGAKPVGGCSVGVNPDIS